MERKLNNSVNMIRTTVTFCNNNTTPTAGIPAFATAKTTVSNKLILIDSLDQIVLGNSKGVTLDTNQLRTTMSDIAFKCGSAVSAFAASVNNNTLRVKVTFSRSAFNRFKKDEVDDICQTIHDEADANIAAAAAFGYDATDVTDLQTAIDLYRLASQNPRQSIISKGQAIENIKLLISEIIKDSFEKLMDKMVDTLRTTEVNFTKGYDLARETINLGVTHAKVRGTTKDTGDVPLIGAAFIIKTTGTNTIVAQTLSKAKGAFSISKIPVGDYDFFWSLTGYQTVTETNVHISAGKELQRKITLQSNSGGTLIIEGDFPLGFTTIDFSEVTSNPLSRVIIELTNAPGGIFATNSPTGVPAGIRYDLPIGTTPNTLVDSFKAFIGYSTVNNIVRIENLGGVTGHYKFTFTLLSEE